MDYSKGGVQGAASCRSFNWPLAVSPFLMYLCSYILKKEEKEEEEVIKKEENGILKKEEEVYKRKKRRRLY